MRDGRKGIGEKNRINDFKWKWIPLGSSSREHLLVLCCLCRLSGAAFHWYDQDNISQKQIHSNVPDFNGKISVNFEPYFTRNG